MNKKLLISFAILLVSSVLASPPNDPAPPASGNGTGTGNGNKCHSSCSQCVNNCCVACTVPHSKIDPLKKACVCEDGYYAESVSPLVCSERLFGSSENCCEKNLGINIGDFKINTQCYYVTNPQSDGSQKDFVVSEVTIDTDHSYFDEQDCRNMLKTEVQYRPQGYNYPNEDDNYIPLNPIYVSDLGTKPGDKKIKIPLINVYDVAYSTTISIDQSQIIQLVYLRILIGFDRGSERIYLRAHRWIMTVYTNRQQVQTFTIDVDIQRTSSCMNGQCIIIADLDVTGDQYLQDYETVRVNHSYVVGDWMYMRIWFIDSTYLKQLSFQQLYFKNDSGQVFDHTSLTDGAETKWNHAHNSLHVKLKLIEPSIGATIQVNMLIETADARRILESSDPAPVQVKQQFKAQVLSTPTNLAANQDSANKKSNSLIMMLGLANLLALVFLF